MKNSRGGEWELFIPVETRGRKPKCSEETENQAIGLYLNGKSQREVASVLQINEKTVKHILKRRNISLRKVTTTAARREAARLGGIARHRNWLKEKLQDVDCN